MNSNLSKKGSAVWRRSMNAIRMESQRFFVDFVKKYRPPSYFGKPRQHKEEPQWRVAQAIMERTTLEDVKFILDHAKKQLKEVNGISNTIVARTTTLASVSAGALIALISYAISRWDKTDCMDSLLFSVMIGSGYLLLQCVFRCRASGKRWKYFHLSLWLLTSTPVMIAGAYLLANYFSWFLC